MTKMLSASTAVGALAALAAAMLAGPASAAAVLDDPLHGYCSPPATQCIDNGTNSPTSVNPPSNFGFTVSPGPASGDFLVKILVPDNEDPSPSTLSYTLSGTLPGIASLVSATAWTSGDLDAYLGISASPANPIGAYLPSTVALDPGANGFFVYEADLGTATLQGPSNPNVSPLENLTGQQIPLASYIVGFLNEGIPGAPDFVATANSGAIFETTACTPGVPGCFVAPPVVPEPGSLALLGSALAIFGAIRRRKSKSV